MTGGEMPEDVDLCVGIRSRRCAVIVGRVAVETRVAVPGLTSRAA